MPTEILELTPAPLEVYLFREIGTAAVSVPTLVATAEVGAPVDHLRHVTKQMIGRIDAISERGLGRTLPHPDQHLVLLHQISMGRNGVDMEVEIGQLQ